MRRESEEGMTVKHQEIEEEAKNRSRVGCGWRRTGNLFITSHRRKASGMSGEQASVSVSTVTCPRRNGSLLADDNRVFIPDTPVFTHDKHALLAIKDRVLQMLCFLALRDATLSSNPLPLPPAHPSHAPRTCVGHLSRAVNTSVFASLSTRCTHHRRVGPHKFCHNESGDNEGTRSQQ